MTVRHRFPGAYAGSRLFSPNLLAIAILMLVIDVYYGTGKALLPVKRGPRNRREDTLRGARLPSLGAFALRPRPPRAIAEMTGLMSSSKIVGCPVMAGGAG